MTQSTTTADKPGIRARLKYLALTAGAAATLALAMTGCSSQASPDALLAPAAAPPDTTGPTATALRAAADPAVPSSSPNTVGSNPTPHPEEGICAGAPPNYDSVCDVPGNVWVSTGYLHSNTQSVSCPSGLTIYGYWVAVDGNAAYTSDATYLGNGRLITITDHSHTSGTHRQAFTPMVRCIDHRNPPAS